MKKKLLLVTLALVVLGGCYRPSWYRANTTYAQLKSDSEWCKSQTNIGSTREEMIEQYEKCMKNKGYELKGKDPSIGAEPAVKMEQKEGPSIAIDKATKVYVGIYTGGGSIIEANPAYRYFHKKNCKHLSSESIQEITAGEAIARGKSMCPDCFRD